MIVGEKDFTDKLGKVRLLSDAEKIALICGQQYKLHQIQDHIDQLKCAHKEGQCILCQDKENRIKDLEDKVKALKAQLYGRSSERRKKFRVKNHKNQGDPEDPNETSKTRTRLPSEQYPDAKIVEKLITDVEPPRCLECAQAMTDSGMRETSERLEMIPMEIFIVRMQRVRYHCKGCQSAPKTAALPARIASHSSLNDSMLIETALAKFYDLIPTERFAKMIRRLSVNISDKLLLSAQNYLAQAFTPIYLALKQEVLESKLIHADESPHRMLERNEGHYNWFLWSFCTNTSVYFEIHETRAGSVSTEFLKQSKANFLMSDVYSGYIRTIREVNDYRRENNISQMVSTHCNDHARRYFYKAQEYPEAEKVLDDYDKIYKIEDEVQALIKKPVYDEPKNTQEALALRQSMDSVFKKIYDQSVDILMKHAPDSAIGVAAKYFINNLTGLTLFMSDSIIPISNAPAERSVRNPAVGRKTWYGTHSRKGVETSAVLFSIFESCRLNDVNPREYCRHQAELFCTGKTMTTPFQYRMEKKSKPPPI